MPSHSEPGLPLIAFSSTRRTDVEIVQAPRWRAWMNDTSVRFANRCLPLLMANECGWALLNPIGFTATWSGGEDIRDVVVDFDELPPRRPPVSSTFGYGILTWGVPQLFRTPPGFNLLVRGPANWPKDGISPLEGLVETDWSVSTFTMNWKLTRPGHAVRFDAGEPFCVILPQRRGELERFTPVHRLVESDQDLDRRLEGWRRGRDELQKRKFISEFVGPTSEAWAEWEGSYFRGKEPSGDSAPEHQTKLRLRPFADERPPASLTTTDAVPADQEPTRMAPAEPAEAPSDEALDAVYRLAEHVVFRAFRSETVVLELRSGLHLELNRVAGRMLDLLAASWPVRAAAEIVAKEYGASKRRAQHDVVGFAGQLLEAEMLVPAEPVAAVDDTRDTSSDEHDEH